jgi:hypothetical protein
MALAEGISAVREDAEQSAIDKAAEEAEEERNREAYQHMNGKQRKLFDLRLKMVRFLSLYEPWSNSSFKCSISNLSC